MFVGMCWRKPAEAQYTTAAAAHVAAAEPKAERGLGATNPTTTARLDARSQGSRQRKAGAAGPAGRQVCLATGSVPGECCMHVCAAKQLMRAVSAHLCTLGSGPCRFMYDAYPARARTEGMGKSQSCAHGCPGVDPKPDPAGSRALPQNPPRHASRTCAPAAWCSRRSKPFLSPSP